VAWQNVVTNQIVSWLRLKRPQAGYVGDVETSDDKRTHSVPLDTEDADDVVIEQQNVGPGVEDGGGEFPDPDAPPQEPAPGAVDDD
jgi:hypothetical protein